MFILITFSVFVSCLTKLSMHRMKNHRTRCAKM